MAINELFHLGIVTKNLSLSFLKYHEFIVMSMKKYNNLAMPQDKPLYIICLQRKYFFVLRKINVVVDGLFEEVFKRRLTVALNRGLIVGQLVGLLFFGERYYANIGCRFGR